MRRRFKFLLIISTIVGVLSLMLGVSSARDINEWLSIDGVISGAVQCEELTQMEEKDTCRGALPFQPEISIRPSDRHEFFAKLGFAAGNGLNEISPFAQFPWATDLESDVKDINGSGRNYLLTSWYKHTIITGEATSLSLTGGIIDSTEYLNNNAFANDEFTQFMNEVFVNDPEPFLPSYDVGAALELDTPGLSFHTVVMQVNENEDGERYNYYGAEITLKDKSDLGEGNYRFLVAGTDQKFMDTTQTTRESLLALAISLDQEVGQILGLFARFGWQKDDAAIDYGSFYSGGLDIKGSAWGGTGDNIGIGYAYLTGGNTDI
ncbi:MAG: carbohydrate porin, partial [Desulfobulbia bacterium]